MTQEVTAKMVDKTEALPLSTSSSSSITSSSPSSSQPLNSQVESLSLHLSKLELAQPSLLASSICEKPFKSTQKQRVSEEVLRKVFQNSSNNNNTNSTSTFLSTSLSTSSLLPSFMTSFSQIPNDIIIFTFDTPSPDDLVFSKRKQAFGTTISSSTTTPSKSSTPNSNKAKQPQQQQTTNSASKNNKANSQSTTTTTPNKSSKANTNVKPLVMPMPPSQDLTLVERDMAAMGFKNSALNSSVNSLNFSAPTSQAGTPTSVSPAPASEKKPFVGHKTPSAAQVYEDSFVGTSGGSTPASGSSTPKFGSGRSHSRLDIIDEYRKRVSEKPILNMVVVGHVDAGKSTMMGHLLFLLGQVNQRTMHKYETEAQSKGKASFAFAWVLDETKEERDRGVTMDVAMTNFETTTKRITLLDAPGHRDFIPNMISGAAQADVAILVVNAGTGEFESGFDFGGQTREHAILVRSLGVTQLIVAVNKLDTTDWSKPRFEELKGKLTDFLKGIGFKLENVTFIPVSGLTGENLVTRNKDCKLSLWYSGPTLFEQIDAFRPPERAVDKPFRFAISDIFNKTTGGFGLGGKILSGSIQTGDKVLLAPLNQESGVVKTIEFHDQGVTWAVAGDTVTMSVVGIDPTHITTGCLLGDPEHPIPSISVLKAKIIVFDIRTPIISGFHVVFHYLNFNEPAVITRLDSLLNKSTGEVTKQNPRAITKNSSAAVTITLNRPVCLELYEHIKEMGRFMLRSHGATIAAGIVSEFPSSLSSTSSSTTTQGAL